MKNPLKMFLAQKKLKYQRIGFCGPAGSGKTTLCNAISAKFKIPVVKEGVREYCAERGITLDLARMNHYSFQWSIMLSRQQEMQKHKVYVTDRTGIDNLMYFLQYAPDEFTFSEISDYRRAVEEEIASMYDIIFVVRPFSEEIEDDGFRHVNVAHNLFWEYAMHGYITTTVVMNDRMPPIYFLKETSLNRRMKEVTSVLTGKIPV